MEGSERFETLAVHLPSSDPADGTRGVSAPIYPAAAFVQPSADERGEWAYSRRGNPTRKVVEATIARLHGGRHCFAFGSGMAAVVAAAELAPDGSELLLDVESYGGTFRWLTAVLAKSRLTPRFVDMTDLAAVRQAVKGAGLLWAESPTNPSLRVVDLAELAAIAREAGAIGVVDNSLTSPYFQRPLELGFDVVVESTTKYLNGHDDLMGGAVVVNDESLAERLFDLQYSGGGVPSPFDCWLLLRGMKTLALRLERQAANALALARFLAAHQAVSRVCYPGLEEDPGHKLAERQMRGGFGGMLSFLLKAGPEAAKAMCGVTRIFQLAAGLGGVESLICYPTTMSHAHQQGTPYAVDPSLIRLSVGIEHVEDLKHDLEQALCLTNG
ncbi:MAG TPA: PLP-dependent transferase [Chloroflexota bacterium]